MTEPQHAGEILSNYLLDISVTEAAKKIGISRVTLSRILNKKAGISADVALKLAIFLNTSPMFWMSLQSKYELAQLQKSYNYSIPHLNIVEDSPCHPL